MKAIAAEPMEPAIFKKSVKLGINKAMPVMSQIMTDLTATRLNFYFDGDPSLKNSWFS